MIIVMITSSKLMMWNVFVISAYCAHSSARPAAIAFRSMHGTCTSPFTGSHVRPSMCSIAIDAAYSICSVDPPIRNVAAPAAIAHAVPTSAWQPASAPLIDAFTLVMFPITPATASASITSSSVTSSVWWRRKYSTPGTMPHAPHVGAVTTVSPPALFSATASVYANRYAFLYTLFLIKSRTLNTSLLRFAARNMSCALRGRFNPPWSTPLVCRPDSTHFDMVSQTSLR